MSSEQKLKIMLYSLEEYDRKQYERYREQFQMKFLKNRLDENTAVYSFDCDAVIACPMDNINAAVIDELVECGVKLLAMRSAGYNNVDMRHAKEKNCR